MWTVVAEFPSGATERWLGLTPEQSDDVHLKMIEKGASCVRIFKGEFNEYNANN